LLWGDALCADFRVRGFFLTAKVLRGSALIFVCREDTVLHAAAPRACAFTFL
jgi:hypothetical protein